MIRIFLGNIGSGKTVSAVREMYMNIGKMKTYTNIRPKVKMDNVKLIKADMIIEKNEVDIKVNRRTGEEKPVYEMKLNKKYWQSINEPINVTLDEVHNMMNARRFMSRQNEIMTNWLSMIRRVLGSSDREGDLTLITQLPNRIDTIARQMATHVRYHVCHYTKRCLKCGTVWNESSESPEQMKVCVNCGNHRIVRENHRIEVWCFRSMDMFIAWRDFRMSSFYNHYLIPDVEQYFPMYDTLQWENLFEDVY